jgi:hypothetical protein
VSQKLSLSSRFESFSRGLAASRIPRQRDQLTTLPLPRNGSEHIRMPLLLSKRSSNRWSVDIANVLNKHRPNDSVSLKAASRPIESPRASVHQEFTLQQGRLWAVDNITREPRVDILRVSFVVVRIAYEAKKSGADRSRETSKKKRTTQFTVASGWNN